jgi:hypothetical protein
MRSENTMPRSRRHNPLQSLTVAYHAFRAEAEGYVDDDALRRATLEDAARVLQAIDEIENGFHRNRMTSGQLERVAADVRGELSFRVL